MNYVQHGTGGIFLNLNFSSSGITSHQQCRGRKTVKGAQSDPNYVSRLLLDCVSVFHKIITSSIVADIVFHVC